MINNAALNSVQQAEELLSPLSAQSGENLNKKLRKAVNPDLQAN